jgi:Na+-driven multidrug efflux pump
VLGAGIAALVASYVGLGLMVGWALRAKYREEYRIFRRENLDRSIIWKIVKLSVPSGLATVFVMTGFLMFFKVVGILDKAASDSAGIDGARIPWLHAILPYGISRDAFVEFLNAQPPVLGAATKVIIDILSLSFMTCMGLGVATATLVSQNLGKGKPDESEAFAWTSVKMAAVFTGLMGLAAALFPDAFMGLFTHDEEVVEAGRLSLRLVGAVGFLLGFGMVLAQALFGAGNTRFVMYAEMAMHFGCLVPLSYVLGVVAGLGLEGVWLSAVIYVILLAAIMTWKFRSGTWKKIRL